MHSCYSFSPYVKTPPCTMWSQHSRHTPSRKLTEPRNYSPTQGYRTMRTRTTHRRNKRRRKYSRSSRRSLRAYLGPARRPFPTARRQGRIEQPSSWAHRSHPPLPYLATSPRSPELDSGLCRFNEDSGWAGRGHQYFQP